jgi:hypothetical protein
LGGAAGILITKGVKVGLHPMERAMDDRRGAEGDTMKEM